MEHVLSRPMGLWHLSVLSSQAARGCVFGATLQSHAALLVGCTAVQRGEFLAGCFSDASRVEPALCGFGIDDLGISLSSRVAMNA